MWTKTKPTKVGWYWFKSLVWSQRLVQVVGMSGNLSAQIYGIGEIRLLRLSGEWQGPVAPPKDD